MDSTNPIKGYFKYAAIYAVITLFGTLLMMLGLIYGDNYSFKVALDRGPINLSSLWVLGIPISCAFWMIDLILKRGENDD